MYLELVSDPPIAAFHPVSSVVLFHILSMLQEESIQSMLDERVFVCYCLPNAAHKIANDFPEPVTHNVDVKCIY